MERWLGADRSQVQVESGAFGQGSHRVVDPADPPRDLSGLAWGAFVCLGLLVLLSLARLVTALDLRSTVVDGGDLVGSYDSYSRWTNFYALLLLITAGVFIAWFFQAYKNLRRLGLQNMRYGNGWAIGSWLIPIFNLFRPKQIANDIWRGSERGVEVSAGWQTVPVSGLVHWWWGLFLAQGFLLNLGERKIEAGHEKLFAIGLVGDGVSQIKTGTTMEVLGDILGIAAAIVAIYFVARVTERLGEIRNDALAQAPQVPQYAQPQHPQAPPAPQFSPPPYQAPSMTQHQAYPPPPQPPPTEQLIQCPDCAEWIQPQANVCRFCGYRLRPLGQ